MTTKTAYVWGPISTFSASLLFAMLKSGWTVHLASKSALQISLNPLDLASSAQSSIEKSAGGADKLKPFKERFVFLDADEPQKGTSYDIILFLGLPSNFDEPRVSRAPFAADELPKITSKLKSVPVIVVSSLFGGVQNDGVVPEEIEFERRKARTHFEGVCQQYEAKILKAVSTQESKWHLVRLPFLLGNSENGRILNFSGLYKVLYELQNAKLQLAEEQARSLSMSYNPDATFWMLPCDTAADLLLKLIEDGSRPTICNMVSTQATLNQEWLQDLARGMELNSIQSIEKDNLSLSSTLRSMLNDNIQVKTRNLFEVLGRYQQAPIVLSSDYFGRVIQYAVDNNWGQSRPFTPEAPFSSEHARAYFEEFISANLNQKLQKALESFTGGLAFEIAEHENCRWLISAKSGKVEVAPFNPEAQKPQVSFLIQAASFNKLASGRLIFEQALLTRALQANGANPIQTIKACDFFRRFLRHNHFEAPVAASAARVLEGALSKD
ncbi:MAG: SCP2 sterol-binding domain-containing protein [Candidatus Obscuribacterales bacterium]|nr:SCP2 sterol-binding domain-containing protein [Candidatus Obscuribacterales bacterium]